MKKLMLALMLVVALAVPVFGQATKTQNTEALAWTSIPNVADGTGIKASAEINCSAVYSTTIMIDWCLAEAAAHDGTEIIVMVASEATVNDAWTVLTKLKSFAVTPVATAIDATEEPAQTVLTTVTNTTGMDWPGKFVFIEHTTPGSCEIVYLVEIPDSTSVTCLDATTKNHTAAASKLWGVDNATGSVVNTWAVSIPVSVSRVKVIFNNWADATGANGYGRVRATQLTAL